jgi:hypothetical protein
MWLERENPNKKGSHLIHKAIILKDRSMAINGHEFAWPDREKGYQKGDWKLVYQKFEPYIRFINTEGPQVGIDATRNSQEMFDDQGRADWSRREQARKITLEEWEGTAIKLWPGSDQKSKAIKNTVTETLFHTRSWTKVQTLPLEDVQTALAVLLKYEASCSTMADQDTPEGISKALQSMTAQIKEQQTSSVAPKATGNGDALVTDSELTVFWAAVKAVGWTEQSAHDALLGKFGLHSSKEIQRTKLDEVLGYFQDNKPAASQPTIPF